MSLYKRKAEGNLTHRDTGGKGLAETETEVVVMQRQAKAHLEPPETGGGKEAFSPRGFRGSMALVIP